MAYSYNYAKLLRENGYTFCHRHVPGFDYWYTHVHTFGKVGA